MRNVSNKSCGENYNTQLCSVTFFFFENRANYDLTWKNKVYPEGPQNTIRRMLISCWIKAINTIEIRSSYCFSMETMVSQKNVNLRLYAHCLSC